MSETPSTCARCGAVVDAGHDFCPKCGNALRTAPPPIDAGSHAAPGKPVPVALIALCALAGLAVLAGGAFLVVSKASGGGTPAPAAAGPGSQGAPPAAGGSGEAAAGGGGAAAPVQEHPLSGTFYCRQGAEFDVDPEDAIFAIDDVVIGKVDDFDGKGGGKTYNFRGPGTYIARFTMKGYRTAWVKIVVTPNASESVISVDTELRER